ncbi:protein phosphatase 1 regulatory subunit 42 [Niabella hibiscisoli]|uniref:protein phosphatase 1 regulatory subunit 42 n=1 Tax=Niabella hibiscisoli TaxID=1825928 RepID=UPI001F0EF0B1|nr:protein phosphatase 1 regulatory subunit 42 [Niabella hibiscisoli]MCH5715926.1 protein phosphatase 1 regulatory subunit 42 [Niabella hibiscisoli]
MSNIAWWNSLEQQWKDTFGGITLGHFNPPTVSEIEQLHTSKVLRLAGPGAPYPNMAFQLTNLSGIRDFRYLEILVVTHHQLKSIKPLQSLKNLKSLFLFNNEIESLEGIEDLTELEQLFVQFNKIDSLKPLQNLTRLKEVYVNNNLITSLEGLTETHADKLEVFFVSLMTD